MQQAGGDVAKLTTLVKDGKVSSEGFFRAIQAGAPLLQQKLAGGVETSEMAMQRLRNEFTVAVGKFDEATGASQKLTGAMGGVASSIAPIGAAATDAALKVGDLIRALGNLANQSRAAISGALTDALGDMILDGEKATDVMKSLVKTLARAALQAALVGSGPVGSIYGIERSAA